MSENTPNIDYDDVIVLVSWMADNGYTAKEIAYAVEKPWKYAAELAEAKRELATS